MKNRTFYRNSHCILPSLPPHRKVSSIVSDIIRHHLSANRRRYYNSRNVIPTSAIPNILVIISVGIVCRPHSIPTNIPQSPHQYHKKQLNRKFFCISAKKAVLLHNLLQQSVQSVALGVAVLRHHHPHKIGAHTPRPHISALPKRKHNILN